MPTSIDVRLRDAIGDDLEAILDIYNEQILTSTSTFDLELQTIEAQQKWFDDHQDPLHPVVVAEHLNQVLGWGSLSVYKSRPAARRTVEISVYVHKDARGLGLGKKLIQALCARGQAAGVHTVVASIVASNTASIRMSEACGFVKVGHLREVGCKFETWLDVVMMQRMLT